MDWVIYCQGLLVILVIAISTWIISIYKKDASIVDGIWSFMLFSACLTYSLNQPSIEVRDLLILVLTGLWAARLSAYVIWRNHGQPEDYRYQQIREKYQPAFAWKSLFIIFIFQALLAWIVSISLFAAITTSPDNGNYIGSLEILAVVLWTVGMTFETVADRQMASFKRNPANQGKVMNKGLWRYTRHPNYFGECLIWWGFFCFAVSSGAWWGVISPLLMTWLLLQFSGVALLEKHITERRPDYLEYIKQTNAFVPGPLKKTEQNKCKEERA